MNCRGLVKGSTMVRKPSSLPAFVSSPGLAGLRVPERRRAVRSPGRVVNQRSQTVCLIGLGTLGTTGAVKVISTILTSASVALGALILGQQLTLEQDQMEQREPCPSCGGTGKEPCMCTRWSDNDVGCSGCGHTGYTKCKSCGGGGTAVPIPVALRRDSSQNRM